MKTVADKARDFMDRYDAAVAPFHEELKRSSVRLRQLVVEEMVKRAAAGLGVEVFDRPAKKRKSR